MSCGGSLSEMKRNGYEWSIYKSNRSGQLCMWNILEELLIWLRLYNMCIGCTRSHHYASYVSRQCIVYVQRVTIWVITKMMDHNALWRIQRALWRIVSSNKSDGWVITKLMDTESVPDKFGQIVPIGISESVRIIPFSDLSRNQIPIWFWSYSKLRARTNKF